MAIQYSASPFSVVSTTFAADTRALIVTGLKNALVSAGWSQLATGGAADFTMQTAVTPNGSLSCAMRIWDPGTTSARIVLRNVSGTIVQGGGLFLAAGAGKIYRVIANKYQFAVFTVGNTPCREFVMGGVPWIPAWLTPITTDWGWLHGNSQGDTDTSVRHSFRTLPFVDCQFQSNIALMSDGYMWEVNGNTNPGGQDGCLKLVVPWKTHVQSPNQAFSGWRWHGDIPLVSEPLLCWGTTSIYDEGKVQGQIWDAIYVHDAYLADTQITLDGHTWWAITNQNYGSEGNNNRGTLFLAVA